MQVNKEKPLELFSGKPYHARRIYYAEDYLETGQIRKKIRKWAGLQEEDLFSLRLGCSRE